MLSLSVIHPVTGQQTDYSPAELRRLAVAVVAKRGRLVSYGVTVDGAGRPWVRAQWLAADGWGSADAAPLAIPAEPVRLAA